jgi:hypothetical protein
MRRQHFACMNNMLVYGDTHFEVDGPRFVAMLQARLLRSRRMTSAWLLHECNPSEGIAVLDLARQVLIDAGMLDQAVADAAEADGRVSQLSPLAEACHELAQHAGDLFYSLWTLAAPHAQHTAPQHASRMAGVLRLFNRVRAGLQMAAQWMARRRLPRAMLTVKIPEGFAFYALYPEQYAMAAQAWQRSHADEPHKRVVVAGVRTIGTTLCAVVSAALRAAGWQVFSVTVRPRGTHFAREAGLPDLIGDPSAQVVIVDEGPGLSGSSMASVAEAFVKAGFNPNQISFLPGHMNAPGQFGSEAVREWWARAPRHASPIEDTPLAGQSLNEALSEATQRLTGDNRVQLHPAAAGLWRAWAYGSAQAAWPATWAPFERPKHIAQAGDVWIMWKFAGLCQEPSGCDGVDAALTHLTRRAQHGWGPLPLAQVHGFVAMPWVCGRPLCFEDADAALMMKAGEYIACVAGEALPAPAQQQSVKRLRDMLTANTHEALGESWAARAEKLSAAAAEWDMAGQAACGDGQLAPCEWRRLEDGRLIKAGGMGHRPDHTLVGAQPVLWDIAGALVEWRADALMSEALLQGYTQAGEVEWNPHSLLFYRAAYAAFKMGQCVFCGDACSDAAERSRLARAAAFYCAALLGALHEA